MEFKSLEKWRVQKELCMSEERLDLAIKRMIKRHPLEDWVQEKVASNGELVTYLKLEFVNWLKEVYYRKEFYLDAEISFFKKQINRLENELNIGHYDFIKGNLTVQEASKYFNKTSSAIYMALTRLRRITNIELSYLDDGKVIISKEAMTWLSENYFRKAYLQDLELYKLALQKYKRELYEHSKQQA